MPAEEKREVLDAEKKKELRYYFKTILLKLMAQIKYKILNL